ncbi:MAG: nitroreductase family protein [Desulfobacterota bacterium]|nr:nitroreductase family protein [Thermodesulfobacteriota bacterium]
MDLFTAIKERRSCRNFLPDPIDDPTLERLLEAAIWAPSPLNSQPWEFIVITSPEIKEKIFAEGERCRQWALEKSGWKWLGSYTLDFLKTVPALIAVVGDPKKSGVDLFMEEGPMGYQAACAAAIQNLHLAAHGLGLSSLWFTLFDKKAMREILRIPAEKVPLALICIGKPASPPAPTPRKELREKVTFLR